MNTKTNRKIFGYGLTALVCLVFLISGCFFKSGPAKPDSKYFNGKMKSLTSTLFDRIKDNDPERIAMIDIVNPDGSVSLLGRYLTFKFYESILKDTKTALVSRGEVLEEMKNNSIKISADLGIEDLRTLAEKLRADTFIMGEIIDTGLKLELNIKMIHVETGSLSSAATLEIIRPRSVMKMYKSF